MKRMCSFLLVLAMALSLTACGSNQAQNASATAEQSVTPQEIAWDLSTIYPDEEAFEAEFSQAETQIKSLTALRGKLNTVDRVISYYTGYDEMNRLTGRLDAYTGLQVYKDQSDSTAKELSGRVSNLITKLSTDTAFALPELFANGSDFLDKVAGDARMKPYLTWFNRDRAQSTHTLPEAQEQLLQPLYQLRDGAYSLYGSLTGSDLTFSNIRFPDGSEREANENNYSAAYNKDYTQEFRIAYYNAMMQPYHQFRNTLAQNMQNYYTAVTKSAVSHKYSSALEAALAPEDTPMSVYSSVLSAADQARPAMERYFTLLEKSLDVTELYNFETNASIADDPGTAYSYAEAQKLVKEALEPLGEDYAAKLEVMFSTDAIDVYPAENKSTGAFAASVPGTHPYILLNYTDNFSSVSALAHELGHAVHMMYSQNQESSYDQNVSSLTSEVTSTLNELLLSDYLMENAKTEKERQYYAAQQMFTLYSTFFTQTFFANFQETMVREVENGGTLTADKLDELWLQTTSDCFGPEYAVTDAYAAGWARIPHFYNGFYVYQYAVGIAAACNIAERLQSGEEGAAEDYLAFLKAGDSGNVVEMLRFAGVDIENSGYIDAFTSRFDRLITAFEETQ
ncbi:M3 family metallopeptidase [Oscillibacter sp. GMB15532]|uniref:M3 family oligoendopeptidase n=1 Tax=Oscillibacter sp. GMB15532 TaxID=3230022 RepID=UPI0034DE3085